MIRFLRKAARKVLEKSYPTVAFGVNTLFAPIIVLAYHRVAVPEHDPQMLAVSPENFAGHLERLSEADVEVVRFDAPWKARSNKMRVCITFDDGYADNYHNALPILERYGFPATFFVTTGPVQNAHAFWWDVIEPFLYEPLPASSPPFPFADAPMDTPVSFYRAVHSILYWSKPERQREVLDILMDWFGKPQKVEELRRPMRPEEVGRLFEHPLATVGAHTHNHPRLALLSYAEQLYEIETSVSLLAEWTGKYPAVLAYPYGGRALLGISGDYTPDSRRIVRKAGLCRAAANYPAQARPWTNQFAIPRHLVRNWGRDTFSRCLAAFRTEGHF